MGGSRAVKSERADDARNDAGDGAVEPPHKPTPPPPSGDASAAANSKDGAGVLPTPSPSAAGKAPKPTAAAAADATPALIGDAAAAATATDVDGGDSGEGREKTSATAKNDKEDENVAPSKAGGSSPEVQCQACFVPAHGQWFCIIPCDHVICASCFGKMHALSTACCPRGSCGQAATGHFVEEVTSNAKTDVVTMKKHPPQMYEKRPLQPLRRDVDAVVTVTSRAAAASVAGSSAASPSGTSGKFQTKTFALSRSSKDDELVSLCVFLHPYVMKGKSIANTVIPPGGGPSLLDRCVGALAGVENARGSGGGGGPAQRQQPMPVPVLPPLAFAHHPRGAHPQLYPPVGPHPAMVMHHGAMLMPPLQPPPHAQMPPPPPHQQPPPGARMGAPPAAAPPPPPGRSGRVDPPPPAGGGGKRTLEVSRKERKNAQARSRAQKMREMMEELGRRNREELTPEELKLLEAYEERRRKKNDRSKEREAERKAEIDRIQAIPEKRRTAEEREILDTFMRVKIRKNEGDRLRRARIKHEVEGPSSGGGRNHVPV